MIYRPDNINIQPRTFLDRYKCFNPFSVGTVFIRKVCRRQILTYKDGPRADKVKERMKVQLLHDYI